MYNHRPLDPLLYPKRAWQKPVGAHAIKYSVKWPSESTPGHSAILKKKVSLIRISIKLNNKMVRDKTSCFVHFRVSNV